MTHDPMVWAVLRKLRPTHGITNGRFCMHQLKTCGRSRRERKESGYFQYRSAWPQQNVRNSLAQTLVIHQIALEIKAANTLRRGDMAWTQAWHKPESSHMWANTALWKKKTVGQTRNIKNVPCSTRTKRHYPDVQLCQSTGAMQGKTLHRANTATQKEG